MYRIYVIIPLLLRYVLVVIEELLTRVVNV